MSLTLARAAAGLAGLSVVAACSGDPLAQLTHLVTTLQPTGPVTGSVEGRILDDSDRSPVAEARVIIGSARTASGSDGRYEVRGLAAGTLLITVEAGGFTTFFGEVTVGTGRTVFDVPLRPARPAPGPSARISRFGGLRAG